MTEEPKRKGMSKGCLIGLIVLAVVIVLVVIAGIVCYSKRDELMKFGMATMVTGVKTELASNPVEGIDTVAVNAMADAFIEKMNTSVLEPEKMALFGQTVQGIIGDQVLDSAEVFMFIKAMVAYYPELEELMPIPEEPAVDSITTE
ncbi:MAG: hypothetical protein OEW00_04785 [candidate division Zixibacteria bacterium]|nr:hypothetical protein [candidate division Zixibacteria bacterium]